MHTFPHRTFAICKVPTVNPSGKNQRFLPAPTGREPLGAVSAAFRRTYYIFPLPYSLKKPGIVTAVEIGVSILSIKYQPKANRQLSSRWLPQSPAVTAPSRRELWASAFPHGFVLLESANCEFLRQKSKIFASSLWQGSLWCGAWAFGAVTIPGVFSE